MVLLVQNGRKYITYIYFDLCYTFMRPLYSKICYYVICIDYVQSLAVYSVYQRNKRILTLTSMVLLVQNGRKCITYIYFVIKKVLTYVPIDMECY